MGEFLLGGVLFFIKKFEDVSREFDEFRVLFFVHCNGHKCWYFYFAWGILS